MAAHGFPRWTVLPLLALALQACEPEPEKAEETAGVEIPVPEEPAKEEAAEEVEPETKGPPRLVLVPVGYDQLAGWGEDSLADALPALRLSCQRLEVRGDGEPVGPKGLAGTVADWRGPCAAFRDLEAGDHEGVQVIFKAWLEPFQVFD